MQRKRLFGIVDNREVDLYTLTNPSGIEVSLTNYGGTVTFVRIPSQCATLFASDTGVTMEMHTSEPGLQLYTGNYLGTNSHGVSKAFPKFACLCLEAQHFPDSPNNSEFPSVVLRVGETYQQTTRYQFFTS